MSDIVDVGLQESLCSRVKFAVRNAVRLVLRAIDERGKDATSIIGESFTKLDSPLIETVAVVEETLDGDTVLIDSKQLTALEGIERAEEEETQRRSITFEKLVLMKLFRHTLSLESVNILTHGESIGLGKEVGHELLVVRDGFTVHHDMSLRLSEANELSRDDPTLMHELVETMLTVGARLTEDNRAGLNTLGVSGSGNADSLAIALHINLLNMGRESKQSLAVRKDSARLVSSNVRVVEAEKTHKHRNVLGHVSLVDALLIHGMHTIEEAANVVVAVEERQGQDTDGRADTVSTTNPAPEAKHILIIDTEFFGSRKVRRNRAQVLAQHGSGVTLALVILQDVLLAGARVQHSLSGREGLAHNHEESLLNIETIGGSVEINGIYVGEELELHVACGSLAGRVMAERLEHEFRTKEGTTDANSYDVLQLSASEASEFSRSDLVCESGNSIKNFMNILDNVSAINNLRGSLGLAESNVLHGSTFSRVDLVTFEHGAQLFSQSLLLGNLVKHVQRSGINLGMSVV